MSVALCAHRFPDGTFCKRRTATEGRFCNYHKAPNATPTEAQRHNDVHPLSRLTQPEDVFDVVRETLNAARHGRMKPSQVWAVSLMVDRWFRAYNEMSSWARQRALEGQYLPQVLEAEQRAAATTDAPLPLPIRIDNPAAMADLDAHLPPLNLKPASDYPGEPGHVPADDSPNSSLAAHLPAGLADGEPREGRQNDSPGRKPWEKEQERPTSLLPQAPAEAERPEQAPPNTNRSAPSSTRFARAESDARLVKLLAEALTKPLRGNGKTRGKGGSSP